MAEKKEDLRIRRTHKLLCDAMFSLLEKKSFDEISVVEICDKAMVHRATFYKHFEDKYAFMEYVTKEKLREFYLLSVSEKEYTTNDEIYHAIIKNVINFVEDNRKMFKISAESSNNNNFFDSIHKIIFEELSTLLEHAKNSGMSFSVPHDIIAQFLTGGFIALIKWWVIDDHEYTKDQMAQFIDEMLNSSSAYRML